MKSSEIQPWPTPFSDRVVHNAYRIDLTGESLRKRRTPLLDA